MYGLWYIFTLYQKILNNNNLVHNIYNIWFMIINLKNQIIVYNIIVVNQFAPKIFKFYYLRQFYPTKLKLYTVLFVVFIDHKHFLG